MAGRHETYDLTDFDTDNYWFETQIAAAATYYFRA